MEADVRGAPYAEVAGRASEAAPDVVTVEVALQGVKEGEVHCSYTGVQVVGEALKEGSDGEADHCGMILGAVVVFRRTVGVELALVAAYEALPHAGVWAVQQVVDVDLVYRTHAKPHRKEG